MTDNEIIKALECCTTKDAKCSDCPAFKKVDRSDCKKYFRGAIDLINRQQSEIERYERENNSKFDKWKLLDDRTKQRYAELYEEAKSVVRAEAIKEFAVRLKCGVPQETGVIRCSDIDNLLKEMVGED